MKLQLEIRKNRIQIVKYDKNEHTISERNHISFPFNGVVTLYVHYHRESH